MEILLEFIRNPKFQECSIFSTNIWLEDLFEKSDMKMDMSFPSFNILARFGVDTEENEPHKV